MKDYFKINRIKNIITKNEILAGQFGLEKEGLRVTKDGKLSLKPHPPIFGDKLKNPYITTDFSESQIEIVTPSFNSIKKAYQFLSFIVDIVNTNIPEDEYIWNQSLPCIIPEEDKIPIAKYTGEGNRAYEYRLKLAQKYGKKLQLISGIHYNFSFNEKTMEKLHKNIPNSLTYTEFKNRLYLKVIRNYLRYKWLIIYLTGSSVGCHETFTRKCINLMNKTTDDGSCYSNTGVSYRNASCGYKNPVPLYPSYETIDGFIEDVNKYIDEGLLLESKELYTQIRMKPKDKDNFLKSLKKDGIQYIEIRTVDINPFDKCGISITDMEFIHLFIIYLLFKEESEYTNWQEESLINEEKTAQNAFNKNLTLIKDKKEVSLKSWTLEIMDEIELINKTLNLDKDNLIKIMKERIENPQKTYAYQLYEIIKNRGYINSQISIAKNNRKTSMNILTGEYITKNEKLKEYYEKALNGNSFS